MLCDLRTDLPHGFAIFLNFCFPFNCNLELIQILFVHFKLCIRDSG